MLDLKNILYQFPEIIEDVKHRVKHIDNVDDDVILYDKKSIEKDSDTFIIGYIKHNHYKEDYKENEGRYLILGDNCYFEVLRKPKRFCKNLGYIRVAENVYVGYLVPRFLFFFILFLCILFVGTAFFTIKGFFGVGNVPINFADTVKSDGIVSNDDLFVDNTEYIDYAGYSLVYATKDEPTILLENPETNDVYFTYTIIDNSTKQEILAETGYIKPGEALPWDAYSILSPGDYNVTFIVNTYDMVNQSVKYTPAVMDNIVVKIY